MGVLDSKSLSALAGLEADDMLVGPKGVVINGKWYSLEVRDVVRRNVEALVILLVSVRLSDAVLSPSFVEGD